MAKTIDYIGQTQTIQKISAYITAALAIAAFYLMNNFAVTETLSFMVRDTIPSQVSGNTVFGLGVRDLWEVQIKWVLITFLLASSVVSLLLATKWAQRFTKGVKDGVQPVRWVEYAVTAVLGFEIVALLSGVTDIVVLKGLTAVIIVSAFLGLLAERQNKGAKKMVKSGFWLSIATAAIPAFIIAATALLTYTYGLIRSPWYVYALYAVFLGWGLASVRVQWQRFSGNKLWKNVGYVERTFASINLVTKILVAAILIIGLQK